MFYVLVWITIRLHNGEEIAKPLQDWADHDGMGFSGKEFVPHSVASGVNPAIQTTGTTLGSSYTEDDSRRTSGKGRLSFEEKGIQTLGKRCCVFQR